MGSLKRLSEHWNLAKRTYREIGIVTRELLSLAKDPPASFWVLLTRPFQIPFHLHSRH